MLQSRLYRLDVVERLKLKDGSWAKLCDYVQIGKFRYPVYSTTNKGEGYFSILQSCIAFPIAIKPSREADPAATESGRKAFKARDEQLYAAMRWCAQQHSDGAFGDSGTFFVTDAEQNPSYHFEVRTFYVALRLYADNTAAGGDPEARYKELIKIANLSTKKALSPPERDLYESTLKAVWGNFSKLEKEKQVPFDKYLPMIGLEFETCYCLFAPGQAGQPAVKAKAPFLHQVSAMPFWTILYAPVKVEGMQLAEPHVGQNVQIISYPEEELNPEFLRDRPDEKWIPRDFETKTSKDLVPQVMTGRITSVNPSVHIQLATPITTSTSRMAPVLSEDGAVVAYLWTSDPLNKSELPAISAQTLINCHFTPSERKK